jgi:hypothetical protein
MDKDDWYRDRILWRAKKNKLFDKKCCEFSDLSDDQVLLINEAITRDITPVLVFWESRDRWIVLGTRAVCSFYDANLVCAELDEIGGQISVCHPAGTEPQSAKSEANFISVEKTGKLIWAPAGAELFALWNILLMFPLGVPETPR